MVNEKAKRKNDLKPLIYYKLRKAGFSISLALDTTKYLFDENLGGDIKNE